MLSFTKYTLSVSIGKCRTIVSNRFTRLSFNIVRCSNSRLLSALRPTDVDYYTVCLAYIVRPLSLIKSIFPKVVYSCIPTQLTQSNPFCTSIISSNQITRAHSDNIIIKNSHLSQIRTSVGWGKCHDEFIIATSLYPYFIFLIAIFMTCSHRFLYSLVLNVRALTPWILTPSDFWQSMP